MPSAATARAVETIKQAVPETGQGEQRQVGDENIAGAGQAKKNHAEYQNGSALRTVYQATGKWPYAQGRDGVQRYKRPGQIGACTPTVGKTQRQYGDGHADGHGEK